MVSVDKLNPHKIYEKSEDVVSRDIHGEFIIIPITSGTGDLEDEFFTLNETGKEIWDRIDGIKTVIELAEELVKKFDGPEKEIERDVTGLMEELYKRRIIIERTVSLQ